MQKLTAIKFDDLPLDLAFKKVKGKGTRKLAYFGDPNCDYCKKFEQDLAKIDDVNVSYPRLEFCTDNAAMIAYAGYRNFTTGLHPDRLAFNVRARWPLGLRT